MRIFYDIVLTGAAFGLVFASCSRKPMHVTNVETEVLAVDSTLNAIQDSAYLADLAVQTEQIEVLVSEVIGYLPEPMDAYLPESPLLNWAADALFFPVKAKRPDHADMAIVNIGGLRCNWPAGDLTVRSLFELMPFENEVVILTMAAADVQQLAEEVAAQGGQGISGMTLEIADGKAQNVRVGGQPIDPERTYYVVTSDYLSGGNDGLTALTKRSAREFVGITMRDQFIAYAKMLTANGQPIAQKPDGRIKIVK